MYCVCVTIDTDTGSGMLEVQNLYGSPPILRRRCRTRTTAATAVRNRPVPLVDLRGPREMSDPGNVQSRPMGGAMKADSPFTGKEWSAHRSQGVLLRAPGDLESGESYGIFPITDSGDNKNHDTSIKIKKMTRIYDGSTKFPKLEECAHFHYDLTELGQIQVCLNDENQENVYRTADGENPDPLFYLRVTSNGKSWTIRRNHENFRMLDKQLHRCIFDRKYSMLPELRRGEPRADDVQGMRKLLGDYLNRFSAIAGSMINCGPVLSWLELDNRGNRLIVTDDSAINTPAIAAAHATKRYNAHATDEISFEVGDIISIIDMPPSDETAWWRGKRGFEVGFFPSEYVEVIGDRIPAAMASQIPETPPKPVPGSANAGSSSSSSGEPVLRKRGKLISFLRMFFNQRPTRTTLKRTGIVKERVFGCDLGEHLLNSGQDVPLVLKSCVEIIETHGIVDGIYRLSGVASNIQKLRVEFDEDQLPDLQSETYLQDIHSISSLLKMYLRELPNPLLTYQLYDKFAAAVQNEENRLTMLHDVVQQLPPPHYRTAEYLIRHLARVAEHGSKTGMHWKNLAIVWAPNLLRSKELETSCNVAALQGVGIQAVVTEYLIMYADIIFNDKMPTFAATNQNGTPKKTRPKSLAVSTPTKLLSLEEARERALNISSDAASPKLKYIDVGGGQDTLPAKYHTVIDWPHKKKSHRKGGKSPVISGWRSLFTRGRGGHDWRAKQKYSLQPPSNVSPLRLTSTNDQALTEDDIAQRRKLRTVKSADSLLAVSLNPCGKPCDTSVSATVDSSYASKPGEGSSHMRKPSDTSTVQSEGGMRPLSKRSVSYDMYYSESDMEATDISPTEDVVFMTKSYTDADSHSSHSGWSHPGAVAMETSDPSYSRMADLEGRFYSHQRHQRHLSDSESIRSQGSYARAASATGYQPSKSPTYKTFDGAAEGRSPRMYDRPKSPRMYSGSKSSRSFDGGRSPRLEMQARAVETDENYYDAVSQILGTQGAPKSHGKGPSPASSHGSGMLSTFQPLPVTTTTTIKTSTSVPAGLSPEAQPPISPRSPTLKERIVKALSPPALRKKMRSPSPSGEEPHSPVSSPPVAKSRRSRSKGSSSSSRTSPPASPKKDKRKPEHEPSQKVQETHFDVQETHFDVQETHFDVQETHFDVQETHFDVQETHFDVNPQAKQLSPIGEMLPVFLQASPGSKRKNIAQDVSPYDIVSPEEEQLISSRGRSPLPRLHPPVQPSGDDLLRSLHQKTDSLEGGEVSDYDNDTLEPPPIPPPRKRRSCEIPITPGNEQYLNELENAERMLAALGSPQNRMSKALSVPNDLQRSRDTLDTLDMGSIGSFNELSKSLDSLLNGVATHPHHHQTHQQQQRYPHSNEGYVAENVPRQDSTPPDEEQYKGGTTHWSPQKASPQKELEYDLQFELETSPISPEQSCPVGAINSSSAQLANVDRRQENYDIDAELQQHNQSMPLDADVGASSDFDVMSSQRRGRPRQLVDEESPETIQCYSPHATELYSVAPKSTSRSSSKSDRKSPAHSDPCSPQRTTPRSPDRPWATRSPMGIEEIAPVYSPKAQTFEGSEDIQLDNYVLDPTHYLLPAQSPTSPNNVQEPVSMSPTVSSPHSQSNAEAKRAEWVHAPKASMEETYIDTDSPPMVRKTAEEAAVSSSVSPIARDIPDNLMSPSSVDEELPPPPPPEDSEMNMSISPDWSMPSPPSTEKSAATSHGDSPSSINSSTEKQSPVLDKSETAHPGSSESQPLNDFQQRESDAEVKTPSASPSEKTGSISEVLDRSMEDEVFTMDMDESYEKIEVVKTPTESASVSAKYVEKDEAELEKSHEFKTKDFEPEPDTKPSWTKDDKVDRVQVTPLKAKPVEKKIQEKSDPVAIMKHMSRSYGGEQFSRDEEEDSTERARSCSGERGSPQTRSLSKTPPAVLPKKSRYEKRVAKPTSQSEPNVSETAKQSDVVDSDEEAIQFDDDKDKGKRQKKRHSPKRQKSVKELLSRFEKFGDSPPKEAEPAKIEEPKVRPLVFQKPKIVHLKSLSPTHTEAPVAVTSSPVPAPRKTIQAEISKPIRSPKPAPRNRPPKHDLENEVHATTSGNVGGPQSPPVQLSDSGGMSDRGDSDEADRPLSGSEDSEGSDRKVRKLSLMFERRNSARSDSLEPPVTTLERRKRSDSGRSESPNETIREENANNRKDPKDVSQSKLQKESNNEKISKLDTKVQEARIDTSSEKENISVRHLSQMFETGRASRSPSSEPRDNNGSNTRGGQASRGNIQGQNSSKPWTAIV